MSTQSKSVAFYTLGCKLNFSETATLSRDFSRHGYKIVPFQGHADIYVINTCTVTKNADKDVRKTVRRAQRINSDAYIILIGCFTQVNPESAASIHGVDAVLGNSDKFQLLDHLDSFEKKEFPEVYNKDILNDNRFISSYSTNERTRVFLKVQDGCDYPCTYCTIPLARGKSRSDTVKNTIKVAENIAVSDAREIVLTGVNVGDFGSGTHESFFDLIQQLDQLEGIDRIRISSIEPNLITEEMIRFCSESNSFVPHFHIPLQSGSNKILSDMKRRYKRELFAERVSQIKSYIPEAAIGADVIVGFPTESDSDFQDTYDFIVKQDISYLHVFSYSERPQTLAATFPTKVEKIVKSERSKILHNLSDQKQFQFHQAHLNKVRPVLFEYMKSGLVFGHTDNYILTSVEGDKRLINQLLPLKLEDITKTTMKGSISR